MSTTIHQEINLPATAQRVYESLIDQTQHSTFTGDAPTEISRDAGGAFSCHGGRIVGRNLELVPGQRIVQAWRAANWAEGVYSVVHIQLVEQGKKTQLTLDHTGVPEGQSQHLDILLYFAGSLRVRKPCRRRKVQEYEAFKPFYALAPPKLPDGWDG